MSVRIFIICSMLLLACSTPGLQKRTLNFYEGTNPVRHSLQVPKGYLRQEARMDSLGVREYYFIYESGASLYFGNNPSWPSMNAPYFDKGKKSDPSDSEHSIQGIAGGRYWKELRIETYRFGYHNVPAEERELFEAALYRLRVR